MPNYGVMLIRLQSPIDEAERSRAAEALMAEFDLRPCDFRDEGPLAQPPSRRRRLIPSGDDPGWLDCNVPWRYGGLGVPHGSPGSFLKLAEWLQARWPTGEIWYGDDVGQSDSIQPFTPAVRADLAAALEASEQAF
jgi:hypothetical protein